MARPRDALARPASPAAAPAGGRVAAGGGSRVARGTLAAAWAIAVLVASLGWAAGALDRAERAVGDARFGLGPGAGPDDRVAVVAIDAKSLDGIGRFPFPRREHARVIANLKAAGAKVIAYDVVFAERTNPVDDDRLTSAIRRAGNVVLAAAETDDVGTGNTLGGAYRDYRATAGSVNFPLDPGGVFRRVPLRVEGLQSFAVAAARRSGAAVPKDRLDGRGAPIDWAGGRGSYRALSFVDVRNGRFDRARVRGRVVVVGATDPNLQDISPTPTSSAMSGAEIEANAIATVLDGAPLRRTPGWVEALLILLLAAVVPLATRRLGPRRGATLAVGLGLLFVMATQGAFLLTGWQLSVAGPVVALVAAIPLTLGAAYTTARVALAVEAEAHARTLSEARLHAVEAADAARHEVERNLHDGAQQKLVALALELDGARRRGDANGLTPVLDDALARVHDTVADLRALARGAYPPALHEGGVDGGLAALVEQLPPVVRLAGRVGRRLPSAVEAVAYFVASEGVANALKHADATRIEVRVGWEGDTLAVSVTDDGRGGANPEGSGLAGLRERVEAHGGRLELRAEGGTALALTLPVEVAQSPGGRSAAARR